MKTRHVFFSTLIAATLAGCATQPPQVAANDGVALEQQCQSVTGSRIQDAHREKCEPVGYPFRSYSRDELDATGEIDIGEALRQIDPTFR